MLFFFICLVEGIGSTKKESEHNASQKMLEELNVTDAELYDMTPAGKQAKKQAQVMQVQQKADSVDMDTDEDDEKVPGEPVGNLITLCLRNKLQTPSYDVRC